MKSQYADIETKMKKVISSLTTSLSEIRAGRANPAIIEKITVDYYGSPTKINQLASVSVPEARVLTIQPYDSSILKGIEKAIQVADIGINPQNDGKIIRLVFPSLTEDRRKEIVKDIKKMGEDSKVAIRNVRRDALEKFKADKKNSVITEDDLKIAEKDIQAGTEDYIKNIDSIIAEKEKEILSI